MTVPKFTGKDIVSAREQINELGLTVREIGEGETVTAQMPTQGAQVAAGSQLILYRGESPEEKQVEVPDLTGLSVKQARNKLQNLGLFLDTSGASPTISGVKIASQAVEQGTEVPYGAVISVTLVDSTNLGEY